MLWDKMIIIFSELNRDSFVSRDRIICQLLKILDNFFALFCNIIWKWHNTDDPNSFRLVPTLIWQNLYCHYGDILCTHSTGLPVMIYFPEKNYISQNFVFFFFLGQKSKLFLKNYKKLRKEEREAKLFCTLLKQIRLIKLHFKPTFFLFLYFFCSEFTSINRKMTLISSQPASTKPQACSNQIGAEEKTIASKYRWKTMHVRQNYHPWFELHDAYE